MAAAFSSLVKLATSTKLGGSIWSRITLELAYRNILIVGGMQCRINI